MTSKKNFPSFKLLTYNCLVQRFIDDEKYPKSDKAHLDFDYRFSLFTSEFSALDPDIICLQEIDESLFLSHWQPWFSSNGFQAHYQKKPKWGNVTALRADKFSLEWIDHRSRALLCLFKCLKNNHALYIANVHLSAQTDKVEEKTNQVKSLFKQIEKHQASSLLTQENSSIVVCGDFNSNPTQGIYKLFTEGKLRADYLDPFTGTSYTNSDLRLPTPMKSAYFEKFGSEPTWTYSYQDKFTDTLDFVFFSPILECLRAQEIVNTNRSKNIPNAANPSDHLPMLVELCIRVSPIRKSLNSSA